MSTGTTPPRGFLQSGRAMNVVSALVVTALVVYLAYMAIDGMGLAVDMGSATVRSLEYREAGQTYVTQIIDNRPVIREQARPEMYIVNLELDGQATAAAVPQSVFSTLAPGQRVQVRYQQRRLSGSLQVLDVSK